MSLLPKLGAILLPNIGGWAGGWITGSQIKPWYEGLKKPDWRPPNWVFGPVWTGLYSGMGYASYLVYQSGGGFNGPARIPLILYGTQLALNWIWTPIFFGAHSLKWGLVDICALYINVVACGLSFYKINPLAGYIFIPYLLWLTLATGLSARIYLDNPEEPKQIENKKND